MTWVGWICFLHGVSIEDEGDNYDINNFLRMTHGDLFFPNRTLRKDDVVVMK